MVDASAHYLGSFVAHGAVLLAMAISVPSLSPSDAEPMEDTQDYPRPVYFPVGAESERAAPPPGWAPDVHSRSDEGTMGDAAAEVADGRYAVAGPADNPDPHVARSEQVDRDNQFLGYGSAPPSGTSQAPTAPWGRDDSLGIDPLDQRGAMRGAQRATALGAEGNGLNHAGDGGPGEGSSSPGRYGYRCRLP